ncbi:MAG: glycosyltransferase family 4 protein [Thermodesulfovibrio sp.]|nr:glycosyltransferase family 4 protein [Thermodesulfovibrio sp.]
MKILHLIYDHINNPWVGGGGAVRCFEINKRLARKGHDITIVSGKYPEAKDYEAEGLKFRFLGNGRNYVLSVFSYAYESIKFLKRYAKEYDITVEDFAPWNPLFSKFFHKRTILQLHQKEGINIFRRYFILGIPFMIIEALYPKSYKKIITVSEESKGKFNVNAKVISNGISEELLKEKISRGEYIGYLGRIDMYHKGLDVLLDAITDIDLSVYIAGKGKDEGILREMINRKGLKDKVRLIGFVSGKDKIDFIKNALFIVMPSRYEAQGIVALEAAALGKPLIVSDIPELRYVTENGFGISFRSEDAESLRQAIEYLLKNEHLIEEMGLRGRRYAAKFTWDKIADEYEKYLYEVFEEE